MENPIKMDHLWVPLFSETPILRGFMSESSPSDSSGPILMAHWNIYLSDWKNEFSLQKGGAFPLPMIVGKSILTIYSLTKKPKDARHIPVKAGVQSRHSTLINVPFHFRIALSAPD